MESKGFRWSRLLGIAGDWAWLLNAMEHAATLGGETLEIADLPTRVRKGSQPVGTAAAPAALTDEPKTLSELEREHVTRTLERTGGDRRRTAELLGIDLSTLYRKLKRWKSE